MIHYYMGVRVSEREANLLRCGDQIEMMGRTPGPNAARIIAKADAIREAIERFLAYRPGDPLVDRRAER